MAPGVHCINQIDTGKGMAAGDFLFESNQPVDKCGLLIIMPYIVPYARSACIDMPRLFQYANSVRLGAAKPINPHNESDTMAAILRFAFYSMQLASTAI